MRLTCNLEPVKDEKTLADLDPGVVAETDKGIRWHDTDDFVLGLYNGYPRVMNGINFSPKADEYLITGKILGKIDMKFEK